MNKVILIGNLTRDAERMETKDGKCGCRFAIAVQRDYKDADGNFLTDFFNAVLWGDYAAKLAGYMNKGKKIAVEGKVQNRTYEDKDGYKRTVTEIFAERVELLTPREKGSEYAEEVQTVKKTRTELTEIDDDDLPF